MVQKKMWIKFGLGKSRGEEDPMRPAIRRISIINHNHWQSRLKYS